METMVTIQITVFKLPSPTKLGDKLKRMFIDTYTDIFYRVRITFPAILLLSTMTLNGTLLR